VELHLAVLEPDVLAQDLLERCRIEKVGPARGPSGHLLAYEVVDGRRQALEREPELDVERELKRRLRDAPGSEEIVAVQTRQQRVDLGVDFIGEPECVTRVKRPDELLNRSGPLQ